MKEFGVEDRETEITLVILTIKFHERVQRRPIWKQANQNSL